MFSVAVDLILGRYTRWRGSYSLSHSLLLFCGGPDGME